MATVTVASNKKVLIIEDMHEVRKNLQISLSSLGFQKLHSASSVKAGLDLMNVNDYDIILCDYNLGESGASGQQFLEYLRKENKLPVGAIFIMITAENNYKTVVSAAEYTPDDYMLKPFTAAAFMARLEKLSKLQTELALVNKAFKDSQWDVVVKEADRIIAAKDKNLFDAMKMKAMALFVAERIKESSEVYEQIIKERELPWAMLGLAKCKSRLGDVDSAKSLCEKIMEENPHHLQTVDFYSQLMLATDNPEMAEIALRKAAELSPENLSRARMLSAISMTNGGHAEAEKLMTDALRKQKHSLVKSALDYSVLAKTLAGQNKTEEAIQTVDIARKQFKDDTSTALLAAAASMTYMKAGRADKAAEEIRVMISLKTDNISSEMATMLAEAYYATGNPEQADSIIKKIIQEDPDNLTAKSHIKAMFASSGKTLDDANQIIESQSKEDSTSTIHVKDVKYKESVEMILDANMRTPDNIDLMSHGALIIATALMHKAVDENLIKQCIEYRNRVVRLNPAHAKLPAINNIIKKLGY